MYRILLPLFFLSSAFAQSNPVASSYRDFTGGLNTDDSSVSLQPNESPNLLNVVIDEKGSLTQRKGYAACGVIPSGNTATNLYEYSKNNGSRNLIVTDNVTIWQTGDCVIYSTITTGLNALDLPRFATVQDNLWIVNGSTWPIIWDGTTASLLDGHNATTPTGPKGRLITYWKSRVWIGNTATEPSGLYFSALVDASGNILSPATSTAAWVTTNLIYFNRDNGSPLYAIKVYRDNLYAFKENDILRLIFESEYTASGITVTKTVSKTGSKFQESIVEMDDGLLRFVGRDGVYAFDGSMVKRVSDKWTPTFYTLKQPSHSEQYTLWDTATDWLTGTLANINTYYFTGSLALNSNSGNFLLDNFNDGNYTSNPTWTEGTSNTRLNVYGNKLAYNAPQLTNYVGFDEIHYIYTTTTSLNFGTWSASLDATIQGFATTPTYERIEYFFVSTSNNPSTTNGYSLEIDGVSIYGNKDGPLPFRINKYSNGTKTTLATKTKSTCYTNGGYACANTAITISDTGLISSVDSTGDCTLSVQDTSFTKYSSAYQIVRMEVKNVGYQYGSQHPTIDNIYISGSYLPTGTYTSQVSTATGLTVWKNFDTDSTLNGQSINYGIRTAATAAGVLTADWRTITSGSIVSSTTDNYVQWMATFTTTDNGVTPVLNSVSAGWVTGDSSKSRITAQAYKSRYWLSGATTIGNDYNDITMVENKTGIGATSGNVTKFDLPLSAMTLWNNNLYGAIGNTSKIVRLDYGDTDDGTAIVSYWDSPDDVYGNPLVYKSINRQIVDFASTPANNTIKVGLSNDLGNTWSYVTFNTAKNPLLKRNTQIINMSANNMLQFRSRIYNDKLGVNYVIYGLHGFGTSGTFAGN